MSTPNPPVDRPDASARVLAALVAVWLLPGMLAVELYVWRYETESPEIVARVLVLAAAVAGFVLLLRRDAPWKVARPLRLLAGVLIAALALRFFSAEIFHAMLLLGPLSIGVVAAWAIARAPVPRVVRRFLTAAILATLHFLVFGYYVVLFIGLETWKQIVSRELVAAYVVQIRDLLAVLPVEPWVSFTGIALLYGAFFGAYFAAAGRISDALAGIPRSPRLPAPVAASALLGAIVFAVASPAVGTWLYRSAVTDFKDPLATTLFAEYHVSMGGSHRMVPNPLGLARDRQIAAAYAAPAHAFTKTIVLITVDALRADQMGVYGHARDNTPFLSRLQREGKLVRFDNAFSTCAESFCGMLAVHASKYWHEVTPKNFTLADVLKRLGYRSHFLLGGDHTRFYGLRGFYGADIDDYRDGSHASGYLNDDQQVVDWVAELPPRDGSPRFLSLHLMSTHMLAKRHPQYKRWQPKTPSVLDLIRKGVPAEQYANHYHDGILQADGMIERIFEHLRTKGLLDDAIVIVTADHGEMLGEGGRFGHGETLLDPVVRVPLLIYDTDRYAYPQREVASVVDVAPTLVDRLGAPIPAHWAGESLARPGVRRFVFLQNRESYAVIGRFGGELYKYQLRGHDEQAFNLTRDVREAAPLSPAAHAAAFAELREQLAPVVAAQPKSLRDF